MRLANGVAVTVFAIAALTFGTGCAKDPEAAQQDRYKAAIESDLVTKFITRSPLTNDKPVLFGVVRTGADDANAISCTYNVGEGPVSAPTSADGRTTSTMVAVFRITDAVPHYHVVPPADARAIIDDARTYGMETLPLSQILQQNGTVTYFEPFPRGAEGQRHFIFASCKQIGSAMAAASATGAPAATASPIPEGGVGAGFAQLFDDAQSNKRGALIVIQVAGGGPAAAAGLKVGDTVLAVNGNHVAGRDVADITGKDIRGPIGTRVRLTLATLDGKQSELTLTRVP